MSFWKSVTDFFTMMRITDFVDIILVAFLIYNLLKLVRETRAGQLVKGILLLILISVLSHWLQFNTLSYIMDNTLQVGFIALIVVFQPELRRVLEKMGRSKFLADIFSGDENKYDYIINEITAAAQRMSEEKTGALMVIECDTKIGEFIKTGTELDAKISSDLLTNIFVPNTPLHDGAVIIRDGKIISAACILPLTQNDSLSRELGTRHRAALGITEVSDAAVVIVSEETGKISFAANGYMTRNLNTDSLKTMLYDTFHPSQAYNTSNISSWKERLKWLKK